MSDDHLPSDPTPAEAAAILDGVTMLRRDGTRLHVRPTADTLRGRGETFTVRDVAANEAAEDEDEKAAATREYEAKKILMNIYHNVWVPGADCVWAARPMLRTILYLDTEAAEEAIAEQYEADEEELAKYV